MTTLPATAEYLLLQVAYPGRDSEYVGVLLLDAAGNRLHLKLRRDWGEVADEAEDRSLLQEIAPDLASKAQELGARELIEWLEENCSNVFRVSPREAVQVDSFEMTLSRLYRKHIEPKVLPFRTHLPVYTLRAAAGPFGEHMEVEPEGWEEAPAALRLTPDMFVAHVTGRSMEPHIPDGSLCIFRYGVTGSRNGRLVLVEHYGEAGENRYTVKRYRSRKAVTEESFERESITLEPINPDYKPWDLLPDSPIRVIAEFVDVLRSHD